MDCSLNYIRNSQYIEDYSRNCEYKLCNYNCHGVKKVEEDDLVDDSTYEIYYNYNIIDDIKQKIIKLFEVYISIEFNSISDYIKQTNKYNNIDILYTLKLLIDNSIPIYNKYGFISYLKEYRGG